MHVDSLGWSAVANAHALLAMALRALNLLSFRFAAPTGESYGIASDQLGVPIAYPAFRYIDRELVQFHLHRVC